jgi:predicted RNA binding protein YcfA (HicA-like mRNA interferase family)
MTRMAPIHWKVLEKVFLNQGFKFARQEGSHRSYVKPGIARPIVIPTYDEVPVSIIKNNLLRPREFREKNFSTLLRICK